MKIDNVIHQNELLSHLHCHDEHVSVKIFPNLGGSLQEFNVNGEKIIDGISVDQDGLDDYANTYKSSVLFPFPNRIEDGKYSFEGNNYQLEVNEIPFNNAIHGLVYNQAFKVVYADVKNNEARIELVYEANGDLPGFPFPFLLKLIYKLSSDRQLKLGFEVSNTGNKTFPFGMGWHPYFRTDHLNQQVLSFASKDHFSVNDRMIPVDKKASELESSFTIEDRSFDDAFLLSEGACQLKGPRYVLNLKFDAADDGYFQIYTPDHRNNIALEPMTCVANSFNNLIGCRTLKPDQTETWNISIEIECN